MWDKLKQLKKWVVESVLWAEKELAGKSGPEKRAVIVARLDDLVKLPWLLEWADGPLIGYLVDFACEKMNWLCDGDFSEANLTEEQKEEVADVLTAPIQTAARGGSVDERLGELYKQYGIEAEASLLLAPMAELAEIVAENADIAPAEPEKPAPTPLKPGYLTPHFKRSEFTCKCGCGKADIDSRLVEMCETIRVAAGAPVRVNSGCRCEARNKKEGGVPKNRDGTGGSFHMYGKAADISCSIGPRKLYELTQALYAAGKLPGLEYCIKYPTFVHIDIGKKRNTRFVVKG